MKNPPSTRHSVDRGQRLASACWDNSAFCPGKRLLYSTLSVIRMDYKAIGGPGIPLGVLRLVQQVSRDVRLHPLTSRPRDLDEVIESFIEVPRP